MWLLLLLLFSAAALFSPRTPQENLECSLIHEPISGYYYFILDQKKLIIDDEPSLSALFFLKSDAKEADGPTRILLMEFPDGGHVNKDW